MLIHWFKLSVKQLEEIDQAISSTNESTPNMNLWNHQFSYERTFGALIIKTLNLTLFEG
jgi:hypothetical protein